MSEDFSNLSVSGIPQTDAIDLVNDVAAADKLVNMRLAARYHVQEDDAPIEVA